MKVEQFLTKVKPGTLAVIIIAIAAILYFLLRKKNVDQSQEAVDAIVIDNSKLEFTDAELNFKTSQLYDAMDSFGTDTDTIMSVLRSLHNSDELLYIIKKFGLVKYFGTGHGLLLGDDENLIGWFHSELSDSELSDVKTEFDRVGVSML
jgi:hypothetical protein